MGRVRIDFGGEPRTAAVENARRDAIVLAVLIGAVMMLIWNGSAFFRELQFANRQFGIDAQFAWMALTLNIALILFGWRRYADLLHEGELRADGERRAAVIASTDGMTGLLNRKGFADRSQSLSDGAQVRGEQLVIISLQLHRFKSINDRHGHEIGDETLRQIASSIVDVAGEAAVVARLSGDEFAIAMALQEADISSAECTADAALKTVTRPFEIGGKMIQVGAFAGMAVAPAGELRIPDLLRRADIALDHAKTGRVARPVWFDAGMERALIVHTEIEQGIRFGLEHHRFVPFFEPQVNLETGEIIGFEVLARWEHPLSGLIGPDVFIPVAEEIGLIGRLSEQVIRSALTTAVRWDPSIKLSVNISPAQLADGWLAQHIVRLLTETGFPAERLVVEITESSLFADLELARSIVTSLKNQGIRLALDDFGTGFSSLSHLRSLPFDMIKVDRCFVTNIHSNRESAAIVRAVSTLASALNVPVCVEGIETEAAHAAVLGLGCALGQGWYFGKPMTADQTSELLARPEQFAPAQQARAASR